MNQVHKLRKGLDSLGIHSILKICFPKLKKHTKEGEAKADLAPGMPPPNTFYM
jgi:hypothetical protein